MCCFWNLYHGRVKATHCFSTSSLATFRYNTGSLVWLIFFKWGSCLIFRPNDLLNFNLRFIRLNSPIIVGSVVYIFFYIQKKTYLSTNYISLVLSGAFSIIVASSLNPGLPLFTNSHLSDIKQANDMIHLPSIIFFELALNQVLRGPALRCSQHVRELYP